MAFPKTNVIEGKRGSRLQLERQGHRSSDRSRSPELLSSAFDGAVFSTHPKNKLLDDVFGGTL